MYTVYIGQWLNLRHLCEPLGGTEGLLETVGLKKMTECVWWSSVIVGRERVPDWGGSKAAMKPWEAKVVWTRRLVLN